MRIEDQIDINKLDWEYIWQKDYQKDRKKGKDWNTVSKDFGKWLENDDYPDVLISSMNISPDDTILDLGAAEGTISLKLAEKAKSVTALDRADKMLEELDKKCLEQGITNVKTVQMDIEDMSLENTPKHDIILASRSFNGIYNIRERLELLNELANKYVYITLFGSSTNEYKREKAPDFEEKLPKEKKNIKIFIFDLQVLEKLGIIHGLLYWSENLSGFCFRTEYVFCPEAVERGRRYGQCKNRYHRHAVRQADRPGKDR